MKNLWPCIHVSFLRHPGVTDLNLPHIFVQFSFPLSHCPAEVSYITLLLSNYLRLQVFTVAFTVTQLNRAVLQFLNNLTQFPLCCYASVSCWCSPNITPLLSEWPKQTSPVTSQPLHPWNGTGQRMFQNTQVSLRTFTQALWPFSKMMSKPLQLMETRRFIKIKVFSLEKISKD